MTGISHFWYSKFYSPRVPPGNDQPLTEETMDSGYEIAQRSLLPVPTLDKGNENSGNEIGSSSDVNDVSVFESVRFRCPQ